MRLARKDVERLLYQAGLKGPWKVLALAGGGNNRVFRIDVGERALLLKVYFRHAADPRDRLATEFSFARFAWGRGLRCLAQPLAQESDRGMAIYEFIDGRKMQADEIQWKHVRQALDFYRGLNRHRAHPDGRKLGAGSEACFSIAQHLAAVDRRIIRLGHIRGTTVLHRQATALVRDELEGAWAGVRKMALMKAARYKIDPQKELAKTERRLSPSDFGFHNAILPGAGDVKLRFIDFEYAGWDDPAKMICDFFTQPAVPVPRKFLGRFTRGVVGDLPGASQCQERVELLLSVYRIKWCCIMLNDFLPVGSKRRGFARGVGTRKKVERQRSQLDKVRAVLASQI